MIVSIEFSIKNCYCEPDHAILFLNHVLSHELHVERVDELSRRRIN